MADWLMDKIKAFANSDEGKKRILQAVAAGGSHSIDDAEKYGKRFIEILKEQLSSIQSKTTQDAFLSYFEPIKVTTASSSGVCEVSINFDSSMTHRESLYPSKYPEGVELQYLFSTGYKAKKFAYGIDRHNRKIRSKRIRKGLDYMSRARAIFNDEFAKEHVVATYSTNFAKGNYVPD